MRKASFIALVFLVINTFNCLAGDTLNTNGKHYQFIKGMTDTVKSGADNYIVKYVTEPEEADIMRSNGKIYVVIVVLATIFAGIIAYMVALDRKISKLEREK